MRFNIKIVLNDNKEYRLEGLNEREAQQTLAKVYDDILNLNEKVTLEDSELWIDGYKIVEN